MTLNSNQFALLRTAATSEFLVVLEPPVARPDRGATQDEMDRYYAARHERLADLEYLWLTKRYLEAVRATNDRGFFRITPAGREALLS